MEDMQEKPKRTRRKKVEQVEQETATVQDAEASLQGMTEAVEHDYSALEVALVLAQTVMNSVVARCEKVTVRKWLFVSRKGGHAQSEQ